MDRWPFYKEEKKSVEAQKQQFILYTRNKQLVITHVEIQWSKI